MSKFNPILNPLSLEVPNGEAGSFTVVSIEDNKISLVMSNVTEDKVKDYNVKQRIEKQVHRALKLGRLYDSFQNGGLLYIILDNRLSQHLYEIASSVISTIKEHSAIQSTISDCSYFSTDCKYTITLSESDNKGDSMSAFTKSELMNYLFINGVEPVIINDIMVTLTRTDGAVGATLGDQELEIRRIASPVEGKLRMIYRLIDLQLGVPMYQFLSTGDVFTFLNAYGDEYIELRDYIVEEFDPSIGELGESQHIGFLDDDVALECYMAKVRMDRRLRPKLGVSDASSVLHDKLMRATKPTLQSLLSTKTDEFGQKFGVLGYGEKGTGKASGVDNIIYDPEPIDGSRNHFGLRDLNSRDNRYNPRATVTNLTSALGVPASRLGIADNTRSESMFTSSIVPGHMSPFKDGKIYYSPRDHRLIAKETLDKPVLTCESYTKWYNLYLLNPDGSITEINGLDLDEHYDGHAWIDHIYNPEAVKAYCEAKDYYLDEQSYELIVGRWVIESEERY